MNAADLIDALSNGARTRGDMVPCPSHDDRTPSLHISEDHGLIYEVVRFEPKDFRQRQPDPDHPGQWIWNLDGVLPVLFRLPGVWRTSQAGGTVWLAEGEKDVLALEAAGVVGTCNPGGAGKWHERWSETLRGAHVRMVVDKDVPGREHAALVSKALAGVVASVVLLQAAEGKDAADHFAAGHGLDDFLPYTIDEPTNEAEPPPPVDDDFTEAVSDAVWRLRVQEEARRQLAAERHAHTEWPLMVSLKDRLNQPRPAQRWRFQELQPAGSRVLLAAQFKSGKTTLRDNALRSLVDGVKFLDLFNVEPIEGRVIVFDAEMSEWQFEDWLADQGITNTERIVLTSLRGKLGTFDIRDESVRARWATQIREQRGQYVVFDCLRPWIDAMGLDENHDAGVFLTAFDALLNEAGATEGMVVHHMGHSGERSRGDSRLRDWPDVEWRLVRENDDPSSPRYFSAFGRDVDVHESLLTYDDWNRHLTMQKGESRRDAVVERALDAIVDLLTDEPEPLSGTQIETALREAQHSRASIRSALVKGCEGLSPRLTWTRGPRKARLYQNAKTPDPANPPAAGSIDPAKPPVRRRG